MKKRKIVYTLPPVPKDSTLSIGRHESSNIKIDEKRISRIHAHLIFKSGDLFIEDNSSSNKTWMDGIELTPFHPYPIAEDTLIEFANGLYGLKITFDKQRSSSGPIDFNHRSKILEALYRKGSLLIGRDEQCDIVLPSLLVSRKHARIEKRGADIYIKDLGSKNGVFINGKQIARETRITKTDNITIGPTMLYLKSGKVSVRYAIIADRIKKVYKGNFVGLQNMSIKIPTGEFVALMGPSGCGKSTLLKGLNGANPVTEGTVIIRGLKLNQENFRSLKRSIGYVPQDDIVHKELTLDQTMYYAAKLRIAVDVSEQEINAKIDQVLKNLNIGDQDLRTKKIAELSGGQRKRVSIAVELLSDPTILFLDEPTSPLDPETIEDFLECIKRLTQQEMTVVMVTHKPSDLKYVKKVIFLSKGGYHTFYGDKDSLLAHFNKKDIIEIYAELKTSKSGKHWNKIWRQRSTASDLISKAENLGVAATGSFFSQLYWLSLRYGQIKLNDRSNLFILLSQPLIIALLIGLIFEYMTSSVLFLIAISAIWFGVSNAAKEIVGEIPIYERERMYNLNIFNYIFSKLIVLSIVALIQAAIFVFIIYLFYLNPGDGLEAFKGPISCTFFMFYLSFSATIFGLFISAFFDTTEKVMSIVPIALIPQIMLAGVVATIDEEWKHAISYTMLGRWGTEGFCHIQDGLGKDSEGEVDNLGVNAIQMVSDSIVYAPGSAIKDLKFYESVEWTWSNSISSNSMAILGLNVVMFFGLYFLLKRKDQEFR